MIAASWSGLIPKLVKSGKSNGAMSNIAAISSISIPTNNRRRLTKISIITVFDETFIIVRITMLIRNGLSIPEHLIRSAMPNFPEDADSVTTDNRRDRQPGLAPASVLLFLPHITAI